MNNLDELYTHDERLMLKLNYDCLLLKSGNKDVRDIANALKGKCKTVPGIIKEYYPFQTPEGRPIRKSKDKIRGGYVWKSFKITDAASIRILEKCLYSFIDERNGKTCKILIHDEGTPVTE